PLLTPILTTCCPSTLLFLLYRHRDPRAPLSFPPRRSSDLRRRAAHRRARRGGRRRLRPRPGHEPRPRDRPRRPRLGATAQRRRADRKSTRLNSSHVKISYAVFCLKKKNDKHTQQTIKTLNE